ncbi:MAG: hypothetical protein WCD76_21050 [Pyrinomonadaceae bacterium]
MRGNQIIGWKTYGVAALALVAGSVAFAHGEYSDGVKGIIFGLALISLRDAVAKILRGIEDCRRSLDNMRGAIDIESNGQPPII